MGSRKLPDFGMVLRFGVVTLAFFAVLYLFGVLVRPDVSGKPSTHTPEQIADAVRAREVAFEPDSKLSLHVNRVVTPTGEAPVLAEMVAAGKLPPVRERLPDVPIVLRGVDGIGRYGGTWLRLANGPEDVAIVSWRMSGATLMRWSPLGYPVEPHIAKSVESSPDSRVWTVKLRRGMRWSDGAPYTTADILYWWEHEIKSPVMRGIVPNWMMIEGREGTIEALDDETIRFTFPLPFPTFREALVTAIDPGNTPAHYLRQYHPDPKVGNPELIARDMAAYKLPSARSLYAFMKGWSNPEHPRLWPWIYRSFRGNPPQVFVRNPYYFVVDEAGNQLPYIDRLQFDVQDSKLLALTAANGGASMQERHIRFSDYTELMSRRDVAGTRVLHWYSGPRSNWVINPNLNRRIDPEDPTTTLKAELLSERRFRQALSVAIDRAEIIKAEQSGIGEPSQVEPGPRSAFSNPRLARSFTQYDPATSNRMLDELGLTGRDSEGYRTFRDGTRMTFYLDYTAFSGFGPAQFVIDDWAAVGIRIVPRERARPLFYTEKDSMNFDFNVWSSESEYLALLRPRYFVPDDIESFFAVGWGRWHQLGGFFGNPRANIRGAIPVPRDHPMYEALTWYYEARRAPTLEKQAEAMRRVTDIGAENTWTIGIASAPPQPVVVDKDLRNVPEIAVVGVVLANPANAGPETYFFQTKSTSPGAIAELKDALITPKLRPGAARAADAPRFSMGRIVGWMFAAVGALLLLMVALRHPFIGRRVLIMVPTMAVISIIVFTIIQLPPGDFLQSRLIQLQESGDPSSEQAIEDLKTVFRYDEPAWKLYLRWVGAHWFVTFSPEDEGLIQGNLGRSMETQQPINNMVGDRIVLTVLVSLATILFTWALAIPIGIYSAVRQYSIGDYVLTLFGFIGMCIPPFLLALVLMAVSGASGLFSPEYAAQPEWSWGKVLDLMAHIWIPIVVLGVGGTASMIRVMRANLLEELKKPYVTTALAKGVRPFRLLMKYPVRLALNPFVSGIGGLFPQLVSGGAIVSMVLSLPMVGPLLLQALFTEDMYLAGSMLMVLSLLGVIGTLVSDLLLLWLDPRIRFDGGSR